MRAVFASLRPSETTRAILECLALPSRAPPTDPARPDDAEERLSPGALDEGLCA